MQCNAVREDMSPMCSTFPNSRWVSAISPIPYLSYHLISYTLPLAFTPLHPLLYLNFASPPTSLIASNFSPIFTTLYLINLGSKLIVLRSECCALALASKRIMKWWP